MKKFSILFSIVLVAVVIITGSVSAFTPVPGSGNNTVVMENENIGTMGNPAANQLDTVSEGKKKKFFEPSPSPTAAEDEEPASEPSPAPEKKPSPSPKATSKPKPSPSPTVKVKPAPKPVASPAPAKKPVKGTAKKTGADRPEKPSPTPLKKPGEKPAAETTPVKETPTPEKPVEKNTSIPPVPPSPTKTEPEKVVSTKQAPMPPIPAKGSIPMVKGERYTYRITWQGKLAGYSKFYVANVLSLAGKTFYKLDSTSQLRIGMGDIEKLSFSSDITVQADKYEPSFFHCTQKQGGIQYDVDCLISRNLVAQTNKSEKSGDSNIYSYEDNNIPVIFFNNLWGRIDTLVEHTWILLRSRRTGKIHAYDPILQSGGTLEIVKEGDGLEAIEVDGKKVKANHFKLIGFRNEVLFDIWTDKWRNILKMEEPGGGITFELTNDNVLSELEKSPGVDMWKERVSRSNIFFPNARDIKFMKVEAEVQGRNIKPSFTDLKGMKQDFEGEAAEGNIKGTFSVNTEETKVEKPLAFPIKEELPPEVQEYTKKEIGIETDDKNIQGKALETAWKSKDVWEAAQRVNKWVKENIVLGISLPSAKMTLANEQGNSESKAMLAIALCRAAGIPTRRAGGVIFSAGNFIPHHWFEVWTGPDAGWVPLDPSTGAAGALGATHIKLFGEGEIWKLNVKVVDFDPKPEERITFINRELTWPVGEERIYAVKNGENVIGKETALMEEVTLYDDHETYKMKLQTHLEMGNRTLDADAIYWMTPQGLPYRYEKEVKSGDMEEKQEFTQSGNMLIQKITGFQGEFTREIPFSQGAYFADPHFLCQWALIAGQFYDIKVGKVYNIHAFIPETLSLESITATVKNFESVESGEKIYDCFRIETNKGIVFWIEKESYRVVKVSFRIQQIDLELQETKLKI